MRPASDTETTPAHGDETETIMRALTAAQLHLQHKTPPSDHWRLTQNLLDEAFRACRQIDQCRKRILFR